MTSIPAPAAPRRSYLLGYRIGDTLRLLPFVLALSVWGALWILAAALLLPRRR